MAENHVLYLGRLVGNLHSLEVLLRVYLATSGAKRRGAQVPHGPPVILSIGDTLDEDEFTNYDSLGELVKKFNADVIGHAPHLQVDTKVVPLRDLLAHGRVSADAPDEKRLRIVKFDRPSGGRVRVSDAALMDEGWFKTNIDLVLTQIERVDTALRGHAA